MNRIKKWISSLAGLLTLVTCLAPPSAQAQVPSHVYGNFTIGTNLATIAASSTVTANSTAISLPNGYGLSILPKFALNSADTSAGNITFTLQLSADGTNYSTSSPLTYAVASNGTNVLVGYKIFTKDTLDGARYARISSIQNAATNVLAITQVQYAYWQIPPGR